MEWPRIEIFAGLSATAGRKRADVIRGGERERKGEGRSLVLRGGYIDGYIIGRASARRPVVLKRRGGPLERERVHTPSS